MEGVLIFRTEAPLCSCILGLSWVMGKGWQASVRAQGFLS